MCCTLCSRQVYSRNHGCGNYHGKFLPMCTLANVRHLSVHTLVESDPYPMAGCDTMVSSPWCTDGSTGVHHFNRYLVIRVHICRLGNLAISPIILCVQEGVESIYCEAKTMQQWPGGWRLSGDMFLPSHPPQTSILHHDWYSECFLFFFCQSSSSA